jgi:hypothetical protein
MYEKEETGSAVAQLSQAASDLKDLLKLRDSLLKLPQCKLQETLLQQVKHLLSTSDIGDTSVVQVQKKNEEIAKLKARVDSQAREIGSLKSSENLSSEDPLDDYGHSAHDQPRGKLWIVLLIILIILVVIDLFT